jgi:hypothetical protein
MRLRLDPDDEFITPAEASTTETATYEEVTDFSPAGLLRASLVQAESLVHK